MAGAFDNQKTGVRILFGIIIGILALSMLLYLVPQGTTTAGASTDVVANIGGETVTASDVSQQMEQIKRSNPNLPPQFLARYAPEILKQLVFQKEIEYEAKRLGITVSDQERADRIKQYLPTAFNGGNFVGMDEYKQQVQQRFQLTVPVFEELVRQGLLEEKFRKLVTDGVSVSPSEIEAQYRTQNEKIKLNYVMIKPDDLMAKINPTDAEIQSYYDQNKTRFQIPEKRVVRYGLLDLIQLRQNTPVTDDDLKVVYQQNIEQYAVPNRVHVEHILLKTVGMTDAEVTEVKKKAEDVLAQAKKKGANFEDLAKKYSEDPGSKTKGGDLGWVIQGQTVPEFEKAAFSLNKGETSDLIKTQYGFHIIKILDKETAHTKPFDEVKDSIRAPYLLQKADQQAAQVADQISADIRQSSKITLDQLAQKYHLTLADTHAVAPNEPVLELGNAPEAKNEIFHLKSGELSLPIRTDRGYVVLSVKEIVPPHQATLAEVRDKILDALKQQKADDQARSKALELEKDLKGGAKFETSAKSLGLDPKVSEPFTRTGSVPGLGSGKQLSAAFALKEGQTGIPLPLGNNWAIYQLVSKEEANMADFDKQKRAITDSLLQQKRTMAFEAFRTALDERLKQEGKLKTYNDKLLKALGGSNAPGEPLS